ncbi:MAG: putative alpha/beta hydrolase [Nocardioides sp.]|nr:putative alpha/beta hydrolase [Nocardioides sp.]
MRAGSGEPLLLIHPFMLSHDVWADVVPLLADEYDVVAVTLPGHWGGPKLRRRDVGLRAFADGVEELMDDLGWATCHIAGNSIGGWLSLELARRGRARTVTAIAPAGGWKRFSLTQFLVGLKFLMLVPMVLLGRLTGDLGARLGFLQRLALRVVVHRPGRVPGERAKNYVRAASNCSAFLPYMWADLRDGGMVADHLRDIKVPVQLVFCELDWLLPPARCAPLYVDGLPDAMVVTLEGLGHVPSYEAPERVADAIREHLHRNRRRSVAG